MKTKARRNEQVVGIDPSKICPLESMYDADIYDALFIRRYSRDSGGEGNYVHYVHYLIVFTLFSLYVFQLRQDLALADHVWQDKRAAIAQSVDGLGDGFRTAMRAGWLSYIQNAYGGGAASAHSSAGQGPLVVDDDE